MKLPNKVLLPLLLALISISCDQIVPKEAPSEKSKRTLIVYINADNNLYNGYNGGQYYGALVDINEMESAWSDSFEATVLVYLNTGKNELPRIYKISHDNNLEKITSPVVYTYPQNVDASLPDVLSQVIRDSREIAPADNYALILWSHGTGWVPKALGTPLKSQTPSNPDSSAISLYSFGSSDSYSRNEMEIDALARALPSDIKFDYIAFDACYMGGIEVAYELRNSCRYFIGSAVETPIDGFEYNLLMEDMVTANLQNIILKNYEYYGSLSGWWQTCAISVVDCSKLEPLAAATKNVITNSSKSLSDIPFSLIQDLSSSYSFRGTYYDFGDFVNKTWAESADLPAFNVALEKAVISKYFLPTNLGSYSIHTFSGLSCFAPKPSQKLAIKAFRDRFAWSTDSAIGLLD